MLGTLSFTSLSMFLSKSTYNARDLIFYLFVDVPEQSNNALLCPPDATL
jgi:hypothetical protein